MTLELRATPEEVMRAVETLQQFAQAKGIPERTIFDLALVLPRADAFGALRADDLAVRGVSKRSGCLVGFFLVAVLAIEPFKYDRGESVARYYATMVMRG